LAITAPAATRTNLLNRLPTEVRSLRSMAAPIRVDPRVMQHPRCGGRSSAGRAVACGVPVAEAGGLRAANLATVSRLRAGRSQRGPSGAGLDGPYLAQATRPMKTQTTPGPASARRPPGSATVSPESGGQAGEQAEPGGRVVEERGPVGDHVLELPEQLEA